MTIKGLPNPMSDDFLQPQPQYGDGAKLQQLTAAAPISGAPMPGAGAPGPTAAAPASATSAPMGLAPSAPAPDPRAAYYRNVAAVWTKLSRAPGATPAVKEMAAKAKAYYRSVVKGQV